MRAAGNGSPRGSAEVGERYKWIALSNTTLGVLIATMDSSIVIISSPPSSAGSGSTRSPPGTSAISSG